MLSAMVGLPRGKAGCALPLTSVHRYAGAKWDAHCAGCTLPVHHVIAFNTSTHLRPTLKPVIALLYQY